ncbi:MAG: TRAP transporter substrate-binding protein DctP [Proteobacteria bacterium]|nr:TRAP transporter substrate-binding protein DctP [Pseudomonadota bacterium]
MKRHTLIIAMTLLSLIMFSVGHVGADEPKVVIKMASIAPKGSNMANIYEDLIKRTYEETNHEVQFKVYWGGVQGDEKDVIRKIKIGQLHGGGIMGPSLGTIVPQVRVTELPYVFWSNGEVSYVRSQLESEMDKRFEEKGFIVLGWLDLGFVYDFSKIPLTSLDIVRKQKWWAIEGDPLVQEIFDTLEISPISLSIADVATALSTNLIDCASSNPFGAVAFQWYTRFKYMTNVPACNILGATIVTKDIWDKISPKSQKIILDISRTEHERIVAAVRQDDAKSLVLLKKAGIKIIEIDKINSPDSQYIFEASKTVRQNLVGKLYSQELLDRTLALVDEYRKNHPGSEFDSIITQ